MKLAFVGNMGSGKTTIADYLERNHGYKRLSLADPIREDILKLMQMRIPDATMDLIKEHKHKFRLIMQQYGTEVIRGFLGKDYWTHICIERASQYQFVAVDDCRFLDEVDLWRKSGGIVVKIMCPEETRRNRLHKRDGEYTDSEWAALQQHESEAQVDSIVPDLVVWNSGDSLRQLALILDDFVYRLETAKSAREG